MRSQDDLSPEKIKAWEDYLVAREKSYQEAKARIDKEFPLPITVRIAETITFSVKNFIRKIMK